MSTQSVHGGRFRLSLQAAYLFLPLETGRTAETAWYPRHGSNSSWADGLQSGVTANVDTSP